jgi:hypothetical protein
MSDIDDDIETIELPTQKSAEDTSNQDTKVSTDPSGEKYIRTDENSEV